MCERGKCEDEQEAFLVVDGRNESSLCANTYLRFKKGGTSALGRRCERRRLGQYVSVRRKESANTHTNGRQTDNTTGKQSILSYASASRGMMRRRRGLRHRTSLNNGVTYFLTWWTFVVSQEDTTSTGTRNSLGLGLVSKHFREVHPIHVGQSALFCSSYKKAVVPRSKPCTARNGSFCQPKSLAFKNQENSSSSIQDWCTTTRMLYDGTTLLQHVDRPANVKTHSPPPARPARRSRTMTTESAPEAAQDDEEWLEEQRSSFREEDPEQSTRRSNTDRCPRPSPRDFGGMVS